MTQPMFAGYQFGNDYDEMFVGDRDARDHCQRFLERFAELGQGPQPTSWAVQRSDLLSIEIEFSQPMDVAVTDFRLVNLGVNAPIDADTEFTLQASHLTGSGTNTVTLTFLPDQLSNGVYELEVLSSAADVNNNLIDGNRDGTGGDSYIYRGDAANKFDQLQADWSGDDGVSVFDFTTFSYWFGEAVPTAPSYADPNRDDGVSVFDFSNFSSAFGSGVTYPTALVGREAIAELRRESNREPNSDIRIQSPALADIGDGTTLDRVLREWNAAERAENQRLDSEPSDTIREEVFSEDLANLFGFAFGN